MINTEIAEHLQGIVSLTARQNRQRVRELMKTDHGRRKLLSRLAHQSIFDERYSIDAPKPPGIIHQQLKSLGAARMCFVLSENSSINEQRLQLEDVLAMIVGSTQASIVSCVAGRLLYFEGELNSSIVTRPIHPSH